MLAAAQEGATWPTSSRAEAKKAVTGLQANGGTAIGRWVSLACDGDRINLGAWTAITVHRV